MIKFLKYNKSGTGRISLSLIAKDSKYSPVILSWKYLSKHQSLIMTGTNRVKLHQYYRKLVKHKQSIYIPSRLGSVFFVGDLELVKGSTVNRLVRALHTGIVVAYYDDLGKLSPHVLGALNGFNRIDFSCS